MWTAFANSLSQFVTLNKKARQYLLIFKYNYDPDPGMWTAFANSLSQFVTLNKKARQYLLIFKYNYENF